MFDPTLYSTLSGGHCCCRSAMRQVLCKSMQEFLFLTIRTCCAAVGCVQSTGEWGPEFEYGTGKQTGKGPLNLVARKYVMGPTRAPI